MQPKQLLFSIALSLALISLPFRVFAIDVEIMAIVPGCGDGIVDTGEQCDTSNLSGASCISQGFSAGSLFCTSACTFNTTSCTSSSGGRSGSGGSSRARDLPLIPATNVVFTGKAYRGSTVTLLKDAQIAATTIADANGNFQVIISGISSGNYIFGVYSEDGKGIHSPLLTFPINVIRGVTIKVSDIFIASTTSIDNALIVGQGSAKSDFNNDKSVNLIDFFIAKHWFNQPSPPESIDRNKDGKIDLIDFSIMAFYWTG